MKIAIIGAGAGGTCAAIELAKSGFDITLLEADEFILNRTSARTPGRLGLGFHYPADGSLQSARTIIRAAIEFKRAFPNTIVADQQCNKPYLGKGWYFITKDSQQTPNEFLNYCQNIREIYREEVNLLDFSYYGNPDEFFRVLNPTEYETIVNTNEVLLGIETAEGILDWKQMAQGIHHKISSYENIKILTRHRVIDIFAKPNSFTLTVEVNKKELQTLFFDVVINATCDYRLILDKKIGYHPEYPWVNRLKLLASIDLPSELLTHHSMFFARGPFAMFTNMGDGTGFATYAPITNHSDIDAADAFPVNWERMIVEGINSETEKVIGDNILQGVAKYIPSMHNAKLRKVIAGVVQHQGTANIYDKHDDLHIRYNTGIFNCMPGYYSLDTGKLCFAPFYGKLLSQMLHK